jgi:hypothetical protein
MDKVESVGDHVNVGNDILASLLGAKRFRIIDGMLDKAARGHGSGYRVPNLVAVIKMYAINR